MPSPGPLPALGDVAESGRPSSSPQADGRLSGAAAKRVQPVSASHSSARFEREFGDRLLILKQALGYPAVQVNRYLVIRRAKEFGMTKVAVAEIEECFNLAPEYLFSDTASSTAPMPRYMADRKGIEPHIPAAHSQSRHDRRDRFSEGACV
jgi:hypothetical protein